VKSDRAGRNVHFLIGLAVRGDYRRCIVATIDKPRLIIKPLGRSRWQPIVTGEVRFSDQEELMMDDGSLVYELNCGLWEEDRFSEDDPILSPRPIARYPGGDREFFFRLDILTTEDLDQELGKDEIYGLLLLRPTEGPGTPLTFKTNLIKRRFRD
jgi:hypothetical protein